MKTYLPAASLVALFLSACSTAQAPLHGSTPKLGALSQIEEAHLPKVKLTPNIVFGVLASEIAIQRGGAASAAPTYLSLAQETTDPRLARRAAELAYSTGDLTLADKALETWENLAPDSEEAHQQRAFTLLRAGRLPEAEARLLQELKQAEPSRAATIFMRLIPLLSRQADHVATFESVKRLALVHSQLPEAHFAVAVAADSAGDQETVQREIALFERIAPAWDLPILWRLDALRRQQPEAALDFIRGAVKARPKASEALLLAGPRLLIGQKEYALAQKGFELVLQRYPQQPDALYALGILDLREKRFAEAHAHLTAALAAGYQDRDFLHLTLGDVSESLKSDQEAMRWYGEVGSGSRHYVQAQLKLAALEGRQGLVQKAIQRLNALDDKALMGGAPEGILLKAQLLRDSGDLAGAYRLLSVGLKRYPGEGVLLYERALIGDRLGRVTAAEADLRRYLRHQPQDAQGLNALGYMLSNRTQRFAEAKKLIEAALLAEPNNPMIEDSMGWVLFKMGRAQAALPYLQRAYQALPDPEVAAHLGEVLWKLGQRDEARRIWAEAVAQDAKNEVLNQTLRRYP